MYIEVLLAVLAVVYPFTLYRGMLAAFKLGQGKEVRPLIAPLKKKPALLTKEQIRERTILENALNYDGTPESQKRVD